jgi:hypothetical protein
MTHKEKNERLRLLISWPIRVADVANAIWSTHQYICWIRNSEYISDEQFIKIVKAVNGLCKAKLDVISKINEKIPCNL